MIDCLAGRLLLFQVGQRRMTEAGVRFQVGARRRLVLEQRTDLLALHRLVQLVDLAFGQVPCLVIDQQVRLGVLAGERITAAARRQNATVRLAKLYGQHVLPAVRSTVLRTGRLAARDRTAALRVASNRQLGRQTGAERIVQVVRRTDRRTVLDQLQVLLPETPKGLALHANKCAFLVRDHRDRVSFTGQHRIVAGRTNAQGAQSDGVLGGRRESGRCAISTTNLVGLVGNFGSNPARTFRWVNFWFVIFSFVKFWEMKIKTE